MLTELPAKTELAFGLTPVLLSDMVVEVVPEGEL